VKLRTSALGLLTVAGVAGLAGAAAVARRHNAHRDRSDRAVRKVGRSARNLEVARLGTRAGGTYAVTQARKVFATAERRQELDTQLQLRTSEQVAEALGHMKGVMMKIGQMLSYLDDGLPEPFREALSQLHQDAPPMSGELAAAVVEEELGRPPDDVFAEWDPTPIAAASIGQVHRAITYEGVAVAVKVQYPGVDDAIRADLENADPLFRGLAMLFPGLEPGPVIAEVKSRFVEELDYRQEAANQRLFAGYFRDHPFITVPEVVDRYSTRRVFTSELAEGSRFEEMERWDQHERDLAAEAIYRFVFGSLYRIHAFNGDPHPGNYLFRPGGRVTFLDFGLVKHFTPADIAIFEAMVRSMVLQPDTARFREVVENAGFLHRGAPMTDEEVGRYFGHFYETIREDRVTTFSPEYNAEIIARLFPSSDQDYAPIARWGNVPGEHVILQRINLGLLAILGRLHATGNWRQIAEEQWPFVDGPPTTKLGCLEADWRARTGP
jgi:predicted unusual protein kinase regulating ubiquinone biosynthesis (AarF/ABC1/UbiB family)